MSFELTDLTPHEFCADCWRKLKEVMRDGKSDKEIAAAFDAAYHADQAEAEASVRVRGEGSRQRPLSPPSEKRGRGPHGS